MYLDRKNARAVLIQSIREVIQILRPPLVEFCNQYHPIITPQLLLEVLIADYMERSHYLTVTTSPNYFRFERTHLEMFLNSQGYNQPQLEYLFRNMFAVPRLYDDPEVTIKVDDFDLYIWYRIQ